MDQRIESFLPTVLALAGENPDANREGVRVALTNCEPIFRAQEVSKRMRAKAAHASRAVCRILVGSCRAGPTFLILRGYRQDDATRCSTPADPSPAIPKDG